jgi:glutamate mutase epsilon subunit
MTTYKAANKTKYDAGGSGDNIIGDGYIKSVEKVWMDSFSFTATVLSTADTITIATIPANKKITDVIVSFTTGLTPTTATINVGIVGDADKFISAAVPVAESGAAGGQTARTVIYMNNTDGFQYVTTAATDIILSIGVIALTAPTTGTIKTIVRYT